jgi:excisionase family DNA binding protein
MSDQLSLFLTRKETAQRIRVGERPIEREMRKKQGMLTLSEAAERLGISLTGLYRRINAGELTSIHIGYRHLVSELAIEAYRARSEAKSHE